ncbi:MAG: DEAD/DEAH box helicase [Planctomycetota bacterium]|nr:DEAD/DEAH box helicase [Planctomycetota bacterium]
MDALTAEGYITPTPIQLQSIPLALTGRDVLGIAQTGTGKTAAFALPVLQQLIANEPHDAFRQRGRAARALVLAPTRELAAQIGESFAAYGKRTSLRYAVVFGGVSQRPQAQALTAGVDVIIATPGRLLDLMQQKLVDLRSISFVVLDEADRMLDMGFIVPIRRIMSAVPTKRQTMLFSATMPREIQHLADSFMKNPSRVAVTPVASTVELIEQRLFHVSTGQKIQLLVHLLGQDEHNRTLVFTKTKHGADRVVKRLRAVNMEAEAIHGNKGQNQRTRALEAFRSGSVEVLVATDIAARGIDVDGITHVINFDLPMEPEAYVHRIGRTARAGASGVAISFCAAEEKGLLKSVERLINKQLKVTALPSNLPIVHQPVHAPAAAKNDAHRHKQGGPRSEQKRRPASHHKTTSSTSAPSRSRDSLAAPKVAQGPRGWASAGRSTSSRGGKR